MSQALRRLWRRASASGQPELPCSGLALGEGRGEGLWQPPAWGRAAGGLRPALCVPVTWCGPRLLACSMTQPGAGAEAAGAEAAPPETRSSWRAGLRLMRRDGMGWRDGTWGRPRQPGPEQPKDVVWAQGHVAVRVTGPRGLVDI